MVELCRRDLICSNRESPCTRERLDDEVLGGTTGLAMLERDRVLELTGVRVDGVVDLGWLTELFVDCLPIRLPMLLRRRDRSTDREVLGEGVIREGREETVGVRLGIGAEAEGVLELVGCLSIRLPIARVRDELSDLDVLGEDVLREGCEETVGVRRGVGAVREGVAALVDGLVFERVGVLCLGVNDRLKDEIRLREELDLDVLGIERWGELGALLRLIWVLDREGLLTRGLACRLGVGGRDEMELRLLRVGMDRCGVERETDRELDRLGLDRVDCRMLWRRAWLLLLLLLLLLLRELRRDDWASAASASNSTAITARATLAIRPLDIFFTRNIVHLLSPAACLSGNPGLPFPHHRRHRIHPGKSSDP